MHSRDCYVNTNKIIDEFAETDYPFMSAVYAIRHREHASTTNGSSSSVAAELDDDNWVPKRKSPRTGRTIECSSPEAAVPSTSATATTPTSNGSQFQPKKSRNGVIIEEKENDPEPKRYDRLPDLMKATLGHAMRKKGWRIMAVEWGFAYYCSPFSQRCRVLSVAVGDPQDGTATYFPCDLVKSVNNDGLMAVIDRFIIPVGYDLQPHLCILCLNLDDVDGKSYANPKVIRDLIWIMQGIFNHRLLVIVDGKDKDAVGLYVADILYGKDSDKNAPSRAPIRKNDSAIRSVIECYLKNPSPTKDYLRTLIRRIN
uniref:Uncharacterized protein n=1 Tax=Panagrolaimus sp. ES5 TaxID=591445 RepID=A0AC34GQI7_9BILA